MRPIFAFAVVLACSTLALRAQEDLTARSPQDKDLSALHQIKIEAFENSQVMDHLWNISDRYGP
ncbi:MAG: hypothetical protein JO051_11340, partial [Acidobacteriaceae bacterium]|nr:hypothetical protein [Acidobacteriaceae bacterium]